MTVTISSDLARRFAAQADIDLDSLPDGTSVGWKSVHPDLRSGHNRDFRWPASGECAEPAAADAVPTGDGCGPGLHVALTALGARQSGVRLGTVLVVAWTAADEIQRTDDKVRLRRCDVLGVADATRANLAGADLTRAYLSGADLVGAKLNGADLTGAYLAGASLYGADLTGANLTRANLTRADLRGADLTRADLRGADLTRADLYSAVSDRWTRWPEGFDAEAAGVTVR